MLRRKVWPRDSLRHGDDVVGVQHFPNGICRRCGTSTVERAETDDPTVGTCYRCKTRQPAALDRSGPLAELLLVIVTCLLVWRCLAYMIDGGCR